jgi:hypothetical protein
MSRAGTQWKQIELSDRWFTVAWLLITSWLLACAFLVGGEYADGYNTIANARFFFGTNPDYFFQRGPLAALVLWPIEVIVDALGLGRFDVRPYHLFSGLLHSAYLAGCWLLLKRTGQTFVPRMIAFAAAILSVVFFSYAPFLSHDIIPGFLFLLLIFLCDRWIRDPSVGTALQLVLLGTAVTLVKQTFALFWLSLCIYAALAFLLKWDESRVSARKAMLLFALAGLSGFLSWIGYGWFAAGEISEVSLLERPLVLINSVSAQYDGEGDFASLFPWTLYLQNLHNYGIATILLLLPGVVLALRANDARMKMIAICWLVSVIALQLVTFKEVRYLAFLAPLSAMLIAPVIPLLQRSRALFVMLLAVVFIDQFRGMTMAAAQLTATPGADVARFVGEVENGGKIISSPNLSFAFMAESPILNDRYNGIFHLSAENLFRLGEGHSLLGKVQDPRDFGRAGIEPGDRVFHSNMTLARIPPWDIRNRPYQLEQLVMAAGNAANIDLKLDGDQYAIQGHGGRFIMFIPAAESGKNMPVIARDRLSVGAIRTIHGDEVGDKLHVIGVVVDSLCLAERCESF